MPKKIPQTKINDAIVELNKVRKSWLKRPGVTAVDVGYKLKGGKLTDELAIRAHVKRKLPAEAYSEHEQFTTHDQPKKLGAFSIDVIEAEYGPSLPMAVGIESAEAVSRRGRVDPLVGGISVGNPRVTAGTLGAIVWDRTDGQVCILSNWHVLCGSSDCAAGEAIYQPGRADGGRAADKIAELKLWRLDRDADAALAKLTGARGYSRDILGLSPIPGVEEKPTLGMNLTKSGRTTGVTEGVIDGVSLSVTINYHGGTVQTFHDQIHIVPLPPWPDEDYEVSMGGDSGSVWVDKDTGKAVGLHFAGEKDPSPTAENAIANRMDKVAKSLNFSFAPLFRPPPIVDDDWRDIIRRILCRYFPWLCYSGPQRLWPSFEPCPPEQVPSPQQPPGPPALQPGRQPPGAYPMMFVDVESLLDEIMDELRRTG
jgi:endonuclease G